MVFFGSSDPVNNVIAVRRQFGRSIAATPLGKFRDAALDGKTSGR
jgi:hypothetical protein